MPTMEDYLSWRGDLSFEERPMNDADNLVISTIAYLDLTGIVPGPGEGSISMSDALEALLDRADGDITPYVRSVARIKEPLVRSVAESRRFGDVQLHDYVDELDPTRYLQFAALQADLTPDLTYVAYRGTDGSIVGWRENFMISYEVTEAQRLAADYLSRALSQPTAATRRYVVGGHSKGGNLVSYAIVRCPRELLDKVDRAYSNDGPGLVRDVEEEGPRDVLGDRFVRIQPSYSVVGQIFDRPEEPRTYVKSNAFGVLQHDPTSWQVTRDGFEVADGLDADAAASDDTLNGWILARDHKGRASVTADLFDVLEAGGAKELSDIATTPQGLQKIIAAMTTMDDETKEIMRELLNNMFASTFAARRENATKTAATLVKAARSTLETYLKPRTPSDMDETSEITSDATKADPNDAR